MQAVVIGNFDGVHCGHRHLFETARRVSPEASLIAVTFEPLPAAVLRPEIPMGRLTPRAEREELLRAACGVDRIVELEPTDAVLGLSPEAFIARLREDLPFELVVEGPDFRFGKARSGDLGTLRALGSRLGFGVVEATPCVVTLRDGTETEARSSVARRLLAEGRVADAAIVFGRAYSLTCPTVRGDQRGRTIGWPTMNIDARGRILPADGVYAGRAALPDGTRAIAAISIGTKPTFGESPRTCEATLLGPDGAALPLASDLYGLSLRLEFSSFIRPQARFDGLAALLAQMEQDRAAILAAAGGDAVVEPPSTAVR
jgi:riboflavin kinase/FMN adenylyltransferase